MKIFASDLHLGHNLSSKQRGFNCLEEHDNVIIDNLMTTVKRGCDLYLLGDTFFTNNNEFIEKFYTNLRKERVNLHFIIGNHDKKIPKVNKVVKTVSHLKDIKENEQWITLCHYPMIVWNRSHYNSWMLYGHIHKDDMTDKKLSNEYSYFLKGKKLNINIDFHKFYPYTFDEIKSIMDKKEDNFDLIIKE